MKNIRTIFALGLLSLFSCNANGLDSYNPQPEKETLDENIQKYYVDASSGNDMNDGSSPDKAWRTLYKANSIKFKPGDTLFFKRGGVFNGVLEISAEGTKEQPVVIDAYGEGAKPSIHGETNSLYAVRIYNSNYVTLQNLEIVNNGDELLSKAGLKIECNEYGVSNGLVIRGLTVKDVNGKSDGTNKYSGGILLTNTGKVKKSYYKNLLIENCHIKDCKRNGIFWAGSGGAYCNRANWCPNRDIIIRNNLVEDVPGDGILPIGCDGVLVEYNVMREDNKGGHNLVAAGIWPWSSDNVVIQYNHVVGHQARTDGQAYDCDFNCRNTVIQYNYSSGNHGGFVLFCNNPNATYVNNIGVLESKVRYNISINDGVRPTSEGTNPSALIHFSGDAENPLIEHNIIHTSPTKVKADYDFYLVRASIGVALVKDPVFRKNVFYAPYTERQHGFLMNGANASFEDNWYIGNIADVPEGTGARTSSKYYQEQVADVDPEGYGGLYKLMEKKTVCGEEFLFVKKDAIEAFFQEMEKEAAQ